MSYIKSLIIPGAEIKKDSLQYWREIILRSLLAVCVAAGTIIVFPVLSIQLNQGLWPLMILSLSVYITATALFILNRIPYKIRTSSVLVLIYIMGCGITYSVGLYSGAPFWFFAFSCLTALLLNRKAVIAANILNAATLIVIYQIINTGIAGKQFNYQINSAVVFLAWLSFVLLSAMISISTSVLVKILNANADREKEINENLTIEVEAHKETEKNLRESEEKHRLLAENIDDVIWIVDLDLNYTYISPAASKLHGWPVDMLDKLKVNDFITPVSLKKAAEVLNEELLKGRDTGDYKKSATLELEMYRSDGSTFWTEISASLLMDEENKPALILGVTRDISERKKNIEEKRRLQKQLAEAKKMEALGILAGGVAHDLNNILSGIVSYPDLILMDISQDDPIREPIITMKEAGLRAAKIIQDLLTLARRGVQNMEVVNLNEVIRHYIDSPEHKKLITDFSNIRVHMDLEPALPPIMGSPVQLGKTVMNLMMNAMEAQPGGGDIFISTTERNVRSNINGTSSIKSGRYVILTIDDRGEGINSESLERIFEPFYTSKKMGRSGTGLGMSVVWGTVQDHNGHITVESDQGKGTTITVLIPATENVADIEKTAAADESFMGNGETVLVIDDEQIQQSITKNILKRLNYTPYTVSSGEEALRFFEDNDAELIILDMILEPGMDGLETYRKIIKMKPGQRAIIASGFAETDRVKEALDIGAGVYIAKPYTLEKIGRAIKNILHSPL